MRCQTPQVVNVFTRWRPSFACLAMSLSTLDFFLFFFKNYERSLLLQYSITQDSACGSGEYKHRRSRLVGASAPPLFK
jgi:hypothetical protein